MDAEKKRGYRTLLMSVLLSAPGPLVLGLGLTVGHSSTQLSDFTRRTTELLAILVSFILYIITNRQDAMPGARKAVLEQRGNRFVGIIMCISGASMIVLTLLSGHEDKGNVLPAFVIAFLGVVTNVYFWRRYTALHRQQGNSILGVQARLYQAKSVVDLCVTSALLAVVLAPGTKLSYYLDTVGALLVSLYMIRCGVVTIREQGKSGSAS